MSGTFDGPNKTNWDQWFKKGIFISSFLSFCIFFGANIMWKGKSAQEVATALFAFGTSFRNHSSFILVQLFPRYKGAKVNISQ